MAVATEGVSEETFDHAWARPLEVLEVERVAMDSLQEASGRAAAAEMASLVLEEPSEEALRDFLRALV